MRRVKRFQIRPLGTWVEPVTDPRPASPFRADWSSTVELLDRETAALGAGAVVLQLDVGEADIKLDGMLRANARPAFPGVRVSFDSSYGPLMYATDRYMDWRANVRAVALSLSALRAVDRYGVTRRGEQYRGWQALGAGPRPVVPLTAETAAQLLSAEAGGHPTPEHVLADRKARAGAYRRAIRDHHPDRGGDPATFRRLTEARDLLDRLEDTHG